MTHACSLHSYPTIQSPYNDHPRLGTPLIEQIQLAHVDLFIASDIAMSTDIVQYSDANTEQMTNFSSPPWDQYQISSKGATGSIVDHTRTQSSHSNGSFVASDHWSDYQSQSDTYQHSQATSLEGMIPGHDLLNVRCLQASDTSGSAPQYGAFRPVVITPPPSDQSGPISPRPQWSSNLVVQIGKKQPNGIRMKPIKHTAIRSDGGIRKKNAKVDIPPGITLENLDYLIEHAETDEQVREFKTQKRLLRNREAAYVVNSVLLAIGFS